MKHFLPIPLSITDSSIAENEGTDGTIYPFVLTEGYAQGVQRYHINRLWEAFVDIDPLAHFSWNNLDPSNIFGTDLHNQIPIATPTSVAVVDTVTIVYVYSTKHYYVSTVTGNVDFTAEDWSSPTNFTDLGEEALYRYLYKEPTQEDSIYWKDLGATNRNKCADTAVNSQSVQNGTSMYFEFEAKNIDKVILFNLIASSSTITVYDPLEYDPDTEIGTYIYENTISDILNTTSIINWRTLSQYTPTFVRSVGWTLPFFTGTATIRITLANDTPIDLKLGEILAGQEVGLGITIDGIPIAIKSSGKIVEQDNGDIIFEDEGDVTKVYHVFNFTMKYDSFTVDSILDKCDAMINRRIVVTAEDTDEIKYRTLVVYGFSRDVSPTFTAGNTKSAIKLQVQRFI